MGLGSELKMFVLNAACIRRFGIGVVNNGNTLEVFCPVHDLMFEIQSSVFQGIEAIVEIGINSAGIHGYVRKALKFLSMLEIVGGQLNLATFEHLFKDLSIAAHGDALESVVKVVVVVGET